MMRFPYSSRREWLLPIIPVTVSVGPHVVSTDALVVGNKLESPCVEKALTSQRSELG